MNLDPEEQVAIQHSCVGDGCSWRGYSSVLFAMKQLGKYKFCDWPIESQMGEVAPCGEIALRLVYAPEETWLCDEHYRLHQQLRDCKD